MSHKIVAAFALAVVCTVAGCGNSEVSKKGIVLKGYGEVKAMPNVAELRLTVQSRDRDNNSTKAIEANSKKCESVRSALTELGIESKQITTESFNAKSVQPYEYEPHYRPKGKPYFQVTSRLLVTTKDIKGIGKVIDASIKGGVTSVDSLSYRFDEPAKLQAEALSLAVHDARAKAEAVAKAGGVKLLHISSVVQARLQRPSPREATVEMPMRQVVARKVAPNTYAAPKEETVSAGVVVTFAIQRP